MSVRTGLICYHDQYDTATIDALYEMHPDWHNEVGRIIGNIEQCRVNNINDLRLLVTVAGLGFVRALELADDRAETERLLA